MCVPLTRCDGQKRVADGGGGRNAFNTLQPNPTYAYGRVPRTRLCEPGARSRNSSLTLNIRTSFCPWGSKPSLCIFGGRSSFVLLRGKSRRRAGGGMERGEGPHQLKEPRHCLTAPDFGQACISISPAVSFVVPFYVQGVAGDSERILVES